MINTQKLTTLSAGRAASVRASPIARRSKIPSSDGAITPTARKRAQSPGSQLMKVFCVVARCHEADGMKNHRRRQGTEQSRQEDQSQAERDLPVRILRPGR